MPTMSSMTGNTTVFVGNVAPGTSYNTGASGITDASVAVVTEAGAVVTGALVSGTKYRIINSKNGTMKYSPVFDGGQISIAQKNAYSAPTEEVWYVGYNGTSGNLDGGTITSGVLYGLRVEFTNFSQYAKGDLIKSSYFKTTTTSEADLAAGLHAAAAKTFRPARGQEVFIERVASGSGSATTGTWSINQYANVATVTFNNGLTVGDYVRIGGTSSTTPVYKITAISGTTITLDNYYQEVSATGLSGYDLGSSPTGWGLQITAKTLSTFNGLDDNWEQVKFIASLQNKTANTANTTTTLATAASEGSGDWKTVRMLESRAHFGLGAETRSLAPMTTLSAIASSSYTYDCIYVRAYNTQVLDEAQISGTKNAYFDFYIFTNHSLNYNASNGYSLATIFGA